MTDTSHNTATSAGNNARVPADIWPIRSAVAIAEGVEICRKTGQMGLITGPSGTGKTTAASATVAALAGADIEAHYVMMTRAHDGLLPGLLRIANAIGAHAQPHLGCAGVYDDLVNHMLSSWQRGGVLVLDEAQFMSEALIDGLRNIADDLRGKNRARGIVMVGTPELAAKINGKVGGRSKHFAPLRGRLYMADIEDLSNEDFETIAAHYELPGKQALELLARVGSGRGGLHNVARVLPMAERIAGLGNPLSLVGLRVAVQGQGVAS